MRPIAPLLALALAAAAAAQEADSVVAASDTSPHRPNVLLLLADDQRPDTIGAWGNDAIVTPNLDALAARGTSFREAHCMGSPHGAICVPSRAMLHTGRAYHSIDINDFPDRRTLGQTLGEAGYTTFGTGKWHNSRGAFRRSFQTGGNVFFGGMCDHDHVPVVDLGPEGFSERREGGKHSSELFADAAVGFLEGYEADAPFFCYVAFTAPHDPRTPPGPEADPYYADRPPLPGNFMGQHPFDCGWMRVRDENLAGWPRTEEVVSDQLCEYYGLITDLDLQVGRILAALEASGRAENTLVIYAADHGLAMGSHGLLGKQSLYEHSSGLPLILAGPNVPKGGRSDALVYLYDLYPTLTEVAGAECPDDLHATSLWPLVRGEQDSVRATLYTSLGKHQRAVRDARWKLIRYPEVEVTQLFDLQEDPLELINLADRYEHAGTVSRLRRELEHWQAFAGDSAPWTADETRSPKIDLTGASRKPDRWQPEWVREKYFDQD